MRQFFKMFFASALAMICTGIVLIFVFAWIISGVSRSVVESPAPQISADGILVLNTAAVLHERGSLNSFGALTGDQTRVPGLYDVLDAISKAANDQNIRGIFLKIAPTANGWATLQQLRDALEQFREKGKFIYAYGEVIPQKTYYLVSVADSIFLNPSGFLELKGLSSEIHFYKKALEKLGVRPQIFYTGEYKSATEPLREEKISDANRLQIAGVQRLIWGSILEAASGHSGVEADTLHEYISRGKTLFPEDALALQLIDGIRYIDQVEGSLARELGKKADAKLNYISVEDYVSYLASRKVYQDHRIAVLFGEGDIVDEASGQPYEIASADFAREIRSLRENKKIKAVVLRINSRGGSALASEVILRELNLLREKKPLIVSMGDMAASGGYYIACQADSIFTLPHTITGSIGIYTMFFDINKLLENKLGIQVDRVKNMPHADFPSFTRPMDDREGELVQSVVENIYRRFKKQVIEGRRMTAEQVDTLAKGRVWHGEDAVRLGLADGIGGLDRAIESAARKAGISSWQIVTYPQPEDVLTAWIRQMKGGVGMAGVQAVLSRETAAPDIVNHLMDQLRFLQKINGQYLMGQLFEFNIQ